jgi:uncharacterized protein (DUF305 family)
MRTTMSMTLSRRAAASAVLFAASLPPLAAPRAQTVGPHHPPAAGGAPAQAESPAVRAFRATADRMHRDMQISYTGDPDRDFAAAMIPHHQGAIDMARVVLEHGRDPEIRALAEGIIRAQEGEIAVLRAWLTRAAR